VEWKSYHRPLVIPVPLKGIADDENRRILDMIQQCMDQASLDMTCLAYHHRIPVYGGGTFCEDCRRWYAPPSPDDDE